jgi:hypothetical protein
MRFGPLGWQLPAAVLYLAGWFTAAWFTIQAITP